MTIEFSGLPIIKPHGLGTTWPKVAEQPGQEVTKVTRVTSVQTTATTTLREKDLSYSLLLHPTLRPCTPRVSRNLGPRLVKGIHKLATLANYGPRLLGVKVALATLSFEAKKNF